MERTIKNFKLKWLIILYSVFFAAGCTTVNDSANKNVPQSFEIFIDGKKITMNPDKPQEGLVITAAFSEGQGGSFSLSALNKPEDFSFSIQAHIGPVRSAVHEVFTCTASLNDCYDDKNENVMLSIYPTSETPKITDGKYAYKSAELGLQPLQLQLTSVEDVYWQGVGPSKRVKGSFKGTLASVDRDVNYRPIIVGALKSVEGTFDLYCILR